MNTILIVSSTEDPCTDLVIEQFLKRGIKFHRFDTDLFQDQVKITLKLGHNGSFSGGFHFPKKNLSFSEIGLVWFRRLAEPSIDKELDYDQSLHNWASEECSASLHIGLSLIDTKFVNPYGPYDRMAGNKWIQMRAAATLGFEVPRSCLTNSLEEISKFWDIVNGNVIFKKVKRGLTRLGDGRRILLHTSKIPKEIWSPTTLQRMRFYPMFLEECISKKYDIRSVVVGDKVFSFAIFSQEVDSAKIDYRTAYIYGEEIRHERIHLGSDVDQKLVAFVKGFNHEFGVIDLILTPDERLVFLEDNPNGQWAWLETRTGAPIAESTATHLINLLNHA